jgi:hypothetical protein
MSGPIVRTGTNPKFWSNWDKAFGKKTETAAPKAAKKTAKKAVKTSSKKK